MPLSYKKDTCSGCDVDDVYIVKRLPGRKLCNGCNKKRLEENKEGSTSKPRNSGNKRKFKKPTGEKSVYLAIWAVRPHICVSCGISLGSEPLAHFFSHIKNKKNYPELMLEPSNIQLLCLDCHASYDFGSLGRINSQRDSEE